MVLEYITIPALLNKMLNPEQSQPSSDEQLTANFILDQAIKIDRLYNQRLIVDSANIPWRVTKVGGEKKIKGLLRFMTLISQGIVLSLRSSDVEKEEIPMLREIVGDLSTEEEIEMDGIWNSIESYGISVGDRSKGLALPNDRHFLAPAGHAHSTISLLRGLGDVTFETLGITDRVSDIPTYWPRKMTHREELRMLTEIGITTERMLLEDDPMIGGDKVFRAAHFLAMSALNAQILLGQKTEVKERNLNIRMF